MYFYVKNYSIISNQKRGILYITDSAICFVCTYTQKTVAMARFLEIKCYKNNISFLLTVQQQEILDNKIEKMQDCRVYQSQTKTTPDG